ncbi:MAG: hypothetical protein ACKV2V_18040 [Blastocatellia bacterium]
MALSSLSRYDEALTHLQRTLTSAPEKDRHKKAHGTQKQPGQTFCFVFYSGFQFSATHKMSDVRCQMRACAETRGSV